MVIVESSGIEMNDGIRTGLSLSRAWKSPLYVRREERASRAKLIDAPSELNEAQERPG
jgi:hypothetical protein